MDDLSILNNVKESISYKKWLSGNKETITFLDAKSFWLLVRGRYKINSILESTKKIDGHDLVDYQTFVNYLHDRFYYDFRGKEKA